MNVILALGVFALLIGASVACVLFLDRRLDAREEQRLHTRCDACISGGGVTMLPDDIDWSVLCDEHRVRLYRIRQLERNMDGES